MRRSFQPLLLLSTVLLGALLLAPTSARAMQENLIGATFCVARDQVTIDIDQPGELDPQRFGDRVYDELKRQLTNAAIRFQEELATNTVRCANSTHAVFVYAGATVGATRAWVIKVDVTDFPAPDYRSWVEVWNSLTFGTSTRTGAALGDDLLARVRDGIRGLVDAYQDVN